jgi:uncharacterized membrane protein
MTLISSVPDKYLPTAISRLVAIVFAVLACTAVSIPQILQKLGISISPKEELLLQAVWFLIFVLIGVLIVFVLAVNEHTKRKGYFSS